MDFGASMASSGLTAALVGLIYAGIQLFKRSRCASHNECCDIDIARAETERHEKSAELVQLVLAQLRREKKNDESEETKEGEEV